MKIKEVVSSALYEAEPSQTPAGGRSWYSYIPGTTDWFRELPGALGMGQSNVTGGEPGKILDPQGHYVGRDGQMHQQPWAARPENWSASGGMGHLPPPTRPVWNTTDNKPPLGQMSYPDQTETTDPDGTQHWRDNYITTNGQMAGMHIVVPPGWNDKIKAGAQKLQTGEDILQKTDPAAYKQYNSDMKNWTDFDKYYNTDSILNRQGWYKKLNDLADGQTTPNQPPGQQPGTPGTFNTTAAGAGIDKLDPATRAKFYADLPNMSQQDKLNWGNRLTALGSPQTPGTTTQPQPGQQPGTNSNAAAPQPASQQGMRPGGNAQAYSLQQQLNQRGANIATDGIIGPQTRAATRNFQSQNGLNVDGIAGPRTQAAFQQPAPNQSPTAQSPTQAAAQAVRPSTPPPTPLPQVPHYAMNTPGAPQSSPAPTTAPLAPGSSNMAMGSTAPPSPTPQPQPQSTTEAYKRLPKMTCADYFDLFEAERRR